MEFDMISIILFYLIICIKTFILVLQSKITILNKFINENIQNG